MAGSRATRSHTSNPLSSIFPGFALAPNELLVGRGGVVDRVADCSSASSGKWNGDRNREVGSTCTTIRAGGGNLGRGTVGNCNAADLPGVHRIGRTQLRRQGVVSAGRVRLRYQHVDRGANCEIGGSHAADDLR